ncbi:MAG: hypothetical protein RL238_1593 [Actinomycetota bacterium]
MGRAAFTTRSILAATIVAAVLTATGAAFAASTGSPLPPVVQQRELPALLEVPTCWGSTDTVPAPAGDGVIPVVLRIEPTALLQLADDGTVLAAETNTGCAPRATDLLYVVAADGSLSPAVGVDVTAVAWTGDFTQFGFVPQG